MSNDQSPPARKVIPYKKGGPRKSPFAEMAFQFTGTALDVAIQQREHEAEESSPEISAPEPPKDEGVPVNPPSEGVVAPPVVERRPSETPLTSPGAGVPKPPPLQADKIPIGQKVQSKRDLRRVTEKRSRLSAPEETNPQFLAFITRWKPFLTETQIGICAHVYQNSIAVDQEYCFTSTAKLMAAVSKTERQIKTVLNQLMEWGFLVKGETVVNTPREQRGTYYKLMIDKS